VERTKADLGILRHRAPPSARCRRARRLNRCAPCPHSCPDQPTRPAAAVPSRRRHVLPGAARTARAMAAPAATATVMGTAEVPPTSRGYFRRWQRRARQRRYGIRAGAGARRSGVGEREGRVGDGCRGHRVRGRRAWNGRRSRRYRLRPAGMTRREGDRRRVRGLRVDDARCAALSGRGRCRRAVLHGGDSFTVGSRKSANEERPEETRKIGRHRDLQPRDRRLRPDLLPGTRSVMRPDG
jgi:hypothetical protein